MTTAEAINLDVLYEQDETAWLEAMAALASEGRYGEMDFPNLSEYLTDMSKRDRREVFNRLIVLLVHLLKWEHQPDQRSGSWRATVREQRRPLRQLLESGTLRNHVAAVLMDAFAEARLQAADESEVDVTVFPTVNPWSLDEILDQLDIS